MKRILLIGCGNPLRSDDGLGWHMAQSLTGCPDTMDVRAVHQLTPELAEPISQADLVIFIDAALGDAPGVFQSEPVAPKFVPVSTHYLNPATLLGIAQQLYGTYPQAVALSI